MWTSQILVKTQLHRNQGLGGSGQIFIGVVTPNMMPSGFTTFDLCLARTCVEAGKLASFGSRDANTTAPPKVDSSTYEITDVDVDLAR